MHLAKKNEGVYSLIPIIMQLKQFLSTTTCIVGEYATSNLRLGLLYKIFVTKY